MLTKILYAIWYENASSQSVDNGQKIRLGTSTQVERHAKMEPTRGAAGTALRKQRRDFVSVTCNTICPVRQDVQRLGGFSLLLPLLTCLEKSGPEEEEMECAA